MKIIYFQDTLKKLSFWYNLAKWGKDFTAHAFSCYIHSPIMEKSIESEQELQLQAKFT